MLPIAAAQKPTVLFMPSHLVISLCTHRLLEYIFHMHHTAGARTCVDAPAAPSPDAVTVSALAAKTSTVSAGCSNTSPTS